MKTKVFGISQFFFDDLKYNIISGINFITTTKKNGRVSNKKQSLFCCFNTSRTLSSSMHDQLTGVVNSQQIKQSLLL